MQALTSSRMLTSTARKTSVLPAIRSRNLRTQRILQEQAAEDEGPEGGEQPVGEQPVGEQRAAIVEQPDPVVDLEDIGEDRAEPPNRGDAEEEMFDGGEEGILDWLAFAEVLGFIGP